MTRAFHTKRLACATCMRPQSTWICRWITAVAQAVEVLIVQHPLEVGNAKGSARQLHLCLSHSRLVTGEVFDLPALLTAPLKPRREQAARNTRFCYPYTPQDKALDLRPHPCLRRTCCVTRPGCA